MRACVVNGRKVEYSGAGSRSLLSFLREDLGLTAAKDGCSGQAVCGACLVEVGGKAVLACSTSMDKVDGKAITTLEGMPEGLKQTLAQAFLKRGAVQCGFCTPGFLTRAKILLSANAAPTRQEVVQAVKPHLCRCTGYVPLVDAILDAAKVLRGAGERGEGERGQAGVGASWPKYGGLERALGTRLFVNDVQVPGMAHGALVFSEHPRARVLGIDCTAARNMPGVIGIFSAGDIPGRRHVGMFEKDWPVYVAVGEITCAVCDVLACVVAESEDEARAAVKTVRVNYEVLPALTDMYAALDSPLVVQEHKGTNVLLDRTIERTEKTGENVDQVLARCAHVAKAVFHTPAVEHGFLETEACVALPEHLVQGPGAVAEYLQAHMPQTMRLGEEVPGTKTRLRVYSQGQGIWHDREDLAALLGLTPENVVVTLVDAGGGFGGKEDMTVQGHAALAAYLLQRPVKVRLNRPESLRMHPKRHAMRLEYELGCDAQGLLQAAKVRVLADAGAYASVSAAVVTRTGTHATSAYHIPNVDVNVKAVYTNNIPAGAFRGFGVNQSNFAMESTLDELCLKGGFDPWQIRYDNAVEEGKMVTTGQILGPGVALKETLLAVKDVFQKHPRVGIACAIKNAGIGNGLAEPCDCTLWVTEGGGLRIDHGWTEMGQGIHTVARQMACEVLGLGAQVPIEVSSCTSTGNFAGSTTASRGTFQLGHALLQAAKKLRAKLAPKQGLRGPADLAPLAGQSFHGHYDSLGQTCEYGPPGLIRNHVSYSFATHVALLDAQGNVEKIVAAHDSGTVINPALFASQICGGVAMGLGYALTESFVQRQGYMASERLRACGLPRAADMPPVEVMVVQKPDPEGPLGAKGVGEICSIPTTAALLNAMALFTGTRCYELPWCKRPEHADPPSVLKII